MSGMTGIFGTGFVLLVLLAGIAGGAAMQAASAKRASRKCREAAVRIETIKKTPGRRKVPARPSAGTSTPPEDKPVEKPLKKRLTASKLIALWMLGLTTVVSASTLYLMRLCVLMSFTGALYPLSALITLCQAGNAVVLAAYYGKSKAENTKGGITYDAALGAKADTNIFDTV